MEGSSALAENYYKKALELNENDWKVHLNLAFLYMREKAYDVSLEFFEKAIELLEEKVDMKILYPYMICLYMVQSWKSLEITSKKILKIELVYMKL